MNKTLLTILIILVLIGGVYFLLNPSAKSEPNLEPTASDSTPVSEVPANDADVKETIVEESESAVEDEIIEEETALEKTGSTVIYTDGGFSPATLTVKVGDTVSFNNEGGLNMWVASANHPTHTLYSEFNQLEATGAGTSYEFTFDNVGEWKYHNHVRPNHFGTISVEE